MLLDSEAQNAVVEGDSTAVISGGRAAYIYGTMTHWSDPEHNSTIIYDGCGTSDAPQETGQLGVFENVYLKNGAQVSIDSDPEIFPIDFDDPETPFYFVRNLQIEEDSKLTTRDTPARVRGSLSMDSGTWHALGEILVYQGSVTKDSHIYFDKYFELAANHEDDDDHTQVMAWQSENDELIALNSGERSKMFGNVELSGSDLALLTPIDVSGNWTGNDTLLRLPAVDTNYDGTDTGGEIAINIDGKATGTCDVLTVVADNADRGQTAQKPKLGDNYITGFKADGAFDEVFLLDNEDAINEGLFLKRVEDVKSSREETYYMWQIAKLDPHKVKYEYTGDAPDGAPALPEEKEYYWRMKVGIAGVPVMEGYTFTGWTTEDADIDGGLLFAAKDASSGRSFIMPDKDVTFTGNWVKDPDPVDPDDPDPADPDDPDPTDDPDDSDTPADSDGSGNPDDPDGTDGDNDPYVTNDSVTYDNPNGSGSNSSNGSTSNDGRDSSGNSGGTRTGDDHDLALLFVLMGLATMCCGSTLYMRRRKGNI